MKYIKFLLLFCIWLASTTVLGQEWETLDHSHNSREADHPNKGRHFSIPNRDSVDCESHRNGRNHCMVNTNNGVRLDREYSRNRCRGNWGYDYYGVWVTNGCKARFTTNRYQHHWGPGYHQDNIVRCQSFGSRRESCSIRGGDYRNIELIHQLSFAPCRGNWGHNRREIWVRNGCKADFRVKRDHHSGGNRPGHGWGSDNEVVCQSKKYKLKYCEVGRVRDVELVEVLSKNPRHCSRNNWGFDNRGIWVNNNCKARFRFFRGGHNGGHRPDFGETRTLKCKSRSRQKKVCARNVRKADLIREISAGKYPCYRNWGIDRYGDLYVKNNCYAEFRVWD